MRWRGEQGGMVVDYALRYMTVEMPFLSLSPEGRLHRE
jgi:hypothetical protein